MTSKTTSRTKSNKRFTTYKLTPWFGEWLIKGPKDRFYGFYTRRRDAVRGFTRLANRDKLSNVQLKIENAYGRVLTTVYYE